MLLQCGSGGMQLSFFCDRLQLLEQSVQAMADAAAVFVRNRKLVHGRRAILQQT